MLYILPGSVQCTDNTVHGVYSGSVHCTENFVHDGVYPGCVQFTTNTVHGVLYTVHLHIEWKGRINIIVFLFSKSITGLILYRI